MKKYTYLLAAIMIAAGAMTSCDKNNDNDGSGPDDKPKEVGNEVKFSLGSVSAEDASRTHYRDGSNVQIDWDTNDNIAIWCDKTTDKDGEPTTNCGYKVTSVDQDKGTPTTDDPKKLYWGRVTEDHTFYGLFGQDIQMVNSATGEVKCKYNRVQPLIYNLDTQTNKKEWSNIDESNPTSMQQSYMVAYKKTKPVEKLELHFKPIMTVLDLVIKGMNTTNDSKNQDIYLWEVTVTIPKDQNKLDANGYFHFNIDENAWPDGKNPGSATTQTATEDDVYKFQWGTIDAPKPLKLVRGDSVHLSLHLPPMDINAQNQVKVSIKSAGWGTNNATIPNATSTVSATPGKRLKIAFTNFVFREYIDLGLTTGTKWATYDVGANYKPTDYGKYYVWGRQKNNKVQDVTYNGTAYYSSETAKDKTFAQLKQQGWISDANGTNTLVDARDAARQVMGPGWHMPTLDEAHELTGMYVREEGDATPRTATISLQTFNDRRGLLLISKINENCIFFPFSGYIKNLYGAEKIKAQQEIASWYHTANPYDKKADATPHTPNTYTHCYGFSVNETPYFRDCWNAHEFGHCVRAVKR